MRRNRGFAMKGGAVNNSTPCFARILFAAHPEQHIQAALRQAVSLAEQLTAELHVLRVIKGQRASESEPQTEAELRKAKEQLTELIPAGDVMELSVRWEVRRGEAAEEIAAYARQSAVDLIVLGSRNRSSLSRFFSGSVADKVYRLTRCPLLTVPLEMEEGRDFSEEEDESQKWDPETLAEGGPAAPAYDLLLRAMRLRATDIHIDPAATDQFDVRFRIDGKLAPYCTLDGDVGDHLVKRFKTLADLDIADPFEPQEGYLRLPTRMDDVQIRVTTAPVEGGEAICLRIHEVERMFRPLDSLGLASHAADTVQAMLQHREGLIVVAGPTGAGKTTTIYSMLQQLHAETHHLLIASIEDPVELNVPFLRQMNVDEARGMTLHRGLRTLLRLDPDVLFVGEIRDGETAEIAMRAASSGRYVFTTLHSRAVAATITAFDDLGVKRRSLSANLTGIVSQRLIRRLCPHCRKRRSISDRERRIFEAHEWPPPLELWEPRGCDDCRQMGYRGRTGVFEVVIVNEALRAAIQRGAGEEELRQTLRSEGGPSLTTDALAKAESGISTLEEVLRMRTV
jgi:type II secretory ATPase GspE/PulE/Tfp pilus assembly ATPase PilB-like protein